MYSKLNIIAAVGYQFLIKYSLLQMYLKDSRERRFGSAVHEEPHTTSVSATDVVISVHGRGGKHSIISICIEWY